MTGGKFAPLLVLGEERDVEQTIETFNATVLEAENQVIGKYQKKKNKKSTNWWGGKTPRH